MYFLSCLQYAHAADLIEYLLSTPTPKVYYKMNVHGGIYIFYHIIIFDIHIPCIFLCACVHSMLGNP